VAERGAQSGRFSLSATESARATRSAATNHRIEFHCTVGVNFDLQVMVKGAA
jgi:hypothetical protein